jgi:iron complex transport system permease protein
VLSACLLAAFRLGFAADPPTLLRVNGPRVLFGAAVGALLALAGALRLVAGASRALRELELLALSAGAAGGGFAAAQLGRGGALAFAAGALAGAALAFALVRALDRPRRWTNLAAAALLVALAAAIALSGTYARARHDFVTPAVAWLLGDLTGASLASGAALLALALGLLAAALHVLHSGAEGRLAPLSLLAFGLGVGAAGPLAFVGTFAPRCVRWLARGAAPRTWLPASLAAGAATVAAIDAVPRLLVGGYDFPFNLPATMLAVPIFLGWNRARLRARAGSAGRAFEWLELALIGGLTLAGVWFAHLLASVIAAAT